MKLKIERFKKWDFVTIIVTKIRSKTEAVFKRWMRGEGELWFCSAVKPQKDFISACKCIKLQALLCLQYITTSDIILVPFIVAVVKFRPPHISRSSKKNIWASKFKNQLLQYKKKIIRKCLTKEALQIPNSQSSIKSLLVLLLLCIPTS